MSPINSLDAALARLKPMTGSASTWAREAHLMTLDQPKRDYFAARIAREPLIRDAISQSCEEWVAGRQTKMDTEAAMFFADRFFYAYGLGVWLRDNEFQTAQSEQNVLLWLLNGAWGKVSVARWVFDLTSSS